MNRSVLGLLSGVSAVAIAAAVVLSELRAQRPTLQPAQGKPMSAAPESSEPSPGQPSAEPSAQPQGEASTPPGFQAGSQRAVAPLRRFARDGLWLLANESVQTELGLTEEQKSKLRKLLEGNWSEVGSPADRSWQQGAGATPPSQSEQPQAELLQGVQQILLPEQWERFQQIRLQWLGPWALQDQQVAVALNISEEQRQKLREILRGMFPRLRALVAGWRAEDARLAQEAERLREDALRQALGVLTPEQRVEFDKMQGEKFPIQREPFLRWLDGWWRVRVGVGPPATTQ